MKSSSQESSSQPPCSPESPPWPPPTHWPPPAWMRSARSRPWLKQLLSAGKVYVLFSFPQRGASLSLSQERHLQPVKGGGLFRFPPPSTGDGYVQRPQVGASALRAARVVFLGAHQVAPNGFLGDPRCWRRARRPQSRPLPRCGTLWHMSPAHRFFRFFRLIRYPRGTPR